MRETAKVIGSLSYYSEIRSMYDDPRRDYHGASHLGQQFSLINKLVPLIEHQEDVLYAAQFLINVSLFHDCYFDYSGSAGLNERVSAEIAYTHIRKIDSTLAKDVRMTILATQHYTSKAKQISFTENCQDPKLALLFLDIDLHSLQSTDYEPNIQQELLNFGYKKEQIEIGRKKFFQSLKPRIESGFFHIPFDCLNSYFDNNLVATTTKV